MKLFFKDNSIKSANGLSLELIFKIFDYYQKDLASIELTMEEFCDIFDPAVNNGTAEIVSVYDDRVASTPATVKKDFFWSIIDDGTNSLFATKSYVEKDVHGYFIARKNIDIQVEDVFVGYLNDSFTTSSDGEVNMRVEAIKNTM